MSRISTTFLHLWLLCPEDLSDERQKQESEVNFRAFLSACPTEAEKDFPACLPAAYLVLLHNTDMSQVDLTFKKVQFLHLLIM